MQRYETNIEEISVKIAEFKPQGDGRREWNISLEPNETAKSKDFKSLLGSMENALRRIKTEFLPTTASLVFRRAYLSDIYNQQDDFLNSELRASSIVGQAPLSGAKTALLCWFQENVTVEKGEHHLMARHGGYSDIWLDFAPSAGDSYDASEKGLDTFSGLIAEAGGSLLKNAVRTWFFVRDIDINYSGVVDARNRKFSTEGLNPSTHYIASTGIGGDSIYSKKSDSVRAFPAPLTFTGYAVTPLRHGQISYLRALYRMSPTHLYGVAFERATAIDYGDRRHIFISGTASIDDRGNVLYEGDIRKQTERMLGNVEALLREGEASWEDVMHATVYLRDIADYEAVKEMVDAALPGIPAVIVLGPVCRPEWLVEIECIAITPRISPFPAF